MDKPVYAPIQEIKNSLLLRKGLKLFIKREDLIHEHISGNKWRKLKYNLQYAKNNNYQSLLTFGGAYSNHIAATAAAGLEYGITTIGVIRGEEHLPLNPTLKLAQKQGMKFHYMNRTKYRNKTTNEVLQELKQIFPNTYIIPEGGSNKLAIRGCMEIMNDVKIPIDTICCSCGTGATIAGISLSLNPKQNTIGFSALKGGGFLKNEVHKFINLAGKKDSKPNFIINTDYHFGGYAKITNELISFINTFYQDYQIKLDPVYTGKMMFGLMDLINKDYFKKGTSILTIHTGGLQGVKGAENRYGIKLFS